MPIYDLSNPDYLRPIRDNNREEIFLVEFHRVFKNTNMSLIRNLAVEASNDIEIMKLFPNLVFFARLQGNDERYAASVLYNKPEDLVQYLSNNQLSIELCQEFAHRFGQPYNFQYLHHTRLEIVIRNLLEHAFLKKVYFFADTFTKEMQSFIIQTYADYFREHKIELLEGKYTECMTEVPGITTAFISNFEDFKEVYDHSPEYIYGRMIVIADGYDNLEPRKVTNPNDMEPKMQYKGLELFDKLNREKKAEISYMFPHAIETNSN